eukprot:scaffold81308_cov24-Phaeocystis_antarctica.AAC.1
MVREGMRTTSACLMALRCRYAQHYEPVHKPAILPKSWQMRAVADSVLEWCGRAVAARLGRAAAGRTPTGAAPAAAWRRGSNRLEAERMLRWPGGCCRRFLPRQT